MKKCNKEINILYKCIKLLISTTKNQLINIEKNEYKSEKEKIFIKKTIIDILNKTTLTIRTLNQIDTDDKKNISKDDVKIIDEFYKNLQKIKIN